MKTITITETKEIKQLKITHDEYAESPREWSNLGFFFTKDSRHISPDGTDHDLYNTMIETGNVANSLDDHIKRMYNSDRNIIYIAPVYKHEHSGIVYRRGEASGFDYSQNGFYFVTAETAEAMGVDPEDHDTMNKIIDEELETYTSWANGEVYQFILYDNNGDIADQCSGFYNIDDIADYLPDEWKDEYLLDYLI